MHFLNLGHPTDLHPIKGYNARRQNTKRKLGTHQHNANNKHVFTLVITLSRQATLMDVAIPKNSKLRNKQKDNSKLNRDKSE